jgi:hypothetical protein
LALALVVLVALWFLAWLCLVVGIVAPWYDFDHPSSVDVSQRRSDIVIALAAVLFVLSGPVAYWIGRRRWLFALPIGLVIAWAVGVVVAAIT